ncbi:hypothetical protein GP475_01335 [Corynebacterium poyangense]|uniref:LGFP repeat-containing protein n=1 Tax=Corynebacterium poyangense TaxID=2684405 RepID=A0A7H0SLJ5_9CORY|nr:hypothetical protein [Corynebacterium poyangense]QNQ89420.1 hypothetical protein GP475_01335 [Corynebacterium poyangense]
MGKSFQALRIVLASLTVFLSFGSVSLARADVFHGRWIYGRIAETYERLGGWGHFGDALIDESIAARDGRYQHFQRDSSIFWHPQVSDGVARQVGGKIREKWADKSWERGDLGFPVTDELPTPGGLGRFNHFEGGSIYWTSTTDAHVVWGAIRQRWADLGWEQSPLGFPTTDEVFTPDLRARFNHFQHGSIYWHPEYGAVEVPGGIRNIWHNNQWERGTLGYPIAVPQTVSGGAVQQFQGGEIGVFRASYVRLPETGDYPGGGLSDWRKVFPLFAADTAPEWSGAATHREVTGHWDIYFKEYAGCPKRIEKGMVCSFPSSGGRVYPLEVRGVSDDGVWFVTGQEHPEGAGRNVVVRFRELKPGQTDKRLLAGSHSSEFSAQARPWVVMDISAFSGGQSAAISGPLSSEAVADEVFGPAAERIATTVPHSTNRYALGEVWG